LPLRIIQIGMGGWGQNWHLNILRPSADIEVVACVDSDPTMLALAQQRLNLPAERCFGSVEAAFDAVGAEAVLITASLPGHVPAALASLTAGKHVLLEKPFAPSLAEARRVVETADACGKVLMISQNYRFFPAARTAAALVRDGTLGPVGAVSIDFRRYSNTAPLEGHRHYTIDHPLLIDMAIHHYDLLRMVLGQEPTRIACQTWNPPWSNFRDPAAAAATISFDKLVVSYRGSWVSPAPQTAWAGEWRIECSGGEIAWTGRGGTDISDDRVTVRKLGKAARRVKLPTLPAIDRAGTLAPFVQAVATGQAPETSGRDNLGTLACMQAMIESAALGSPVLVPQVSG
jgi:predicted dehydrogenase